MQTRFWNDSQDLREADSQMAISSLADSMTKTQVLRTLGWPCHPEGAVDVCPYDHSAEHYEIYNLYKHVMSQ